MLASQRIEYLQKALLDYRAQTRKSGEMHAMADGLSEDDIDNLAALLCASKSAGGAVRAAASQVTKIKP